MALPIPPTTEELEHHAILSREEWLTARRAFLEKEKELTRLNEELSELRRQLPWVRVDKDYHFDTPDGHKTLAELFDGRSQLLIYHFMFGPGWKDGCKGCSFLSDHFDGPNLHLPHHDVTLVVVSRAPRAEFEPFKKRMGWKFSWLSSHGSEFNYDFHVSSSPEQLASGSIFYNFTDVKSEDCGEEHPGMSVFFKNSKGEVFHTYSGYARGLEFLCGTHQLLDLTPKGRNEHTIMDWVRRHDEYETAIKSGPCNCEAN